MVYRFSCCDLVAYRSIFAMQPGSGHHDGSAEIFQYGTYNGLGNMVSVNHIFQELLRTAGSNVRRSLTI